jgi:hypothetical protein
VRRVGAARAMIAAAEAFDCWAMIASGRSGLDAPATMKSPQDTCPHGAGQCDPKLALKRPVWDRKAE